MSDAPVRIESQWPGLVRAARWLSAIVLAGVVASGFWMFILQEGHTGRIFNHTWTGHDFPDGLGHALGATEPARTGLVATVLLGIVAAIAFAALERVLPGKGWHKGLSYAVVLFALWGFVFTPLVNSRQVLRIEDAEFVYLPTGILGLDAGWGTIVSAVVASLVAGIVIARIVPLVRQAEWWQVHERALHEPLIDRGAGALLELPEQRPEQRGERTG